VSLGAGSIGLNERVEASLGAGCGLVTLGLVGMRQGAGVGRQPDGAGSACRALSDSSNCLAHGQQVRNWSR